MTKKKASSETGIVSWQDMMATEAKEVAKTERPSVGRISLQSGIMTYQDQAVPNNEMIAIVADVIHEQVYYDQPYEAGVVNPPACFGYGNPGDKMHECEFAFGPDAAVKPVYKKPKFKLTILSDSVDWFKEKEWFIGHIQEYPDYESQGKTMNELRENKVI